VKHTAVLAVGGNHITNDLAFGLGAPVSEAERIKKDYGCAYGPLVESGTMVEVRGMGERPAQQVTARDLCDIIEPRVEEMLQMAWREIMQSGYAENMRAGVVLTGGTALLRGIGELAEEVFGVSVRCGMPRGIEGIVGMVNSPMYATGVGLLQFGVKQHHYGRSSKFTDDHLFMKIYHRMRDWFGEYLS
jgi:cell division protein FtsA